MQRKVVAESKQCSVAGLHVTVIQHYKSKYNTVHLYINLNSAKIINGTSPVSSTFMTRINPIQAQLSALTNNMCRI